MPSFKRRIIRRDLRQHYMILPLAPGIIRRTQLLLLLIATPKKLTHRVNFDSMSEEGIFVKYRNKPLLTLNSFRTRKTIDINYYLAETFLQLIVICKSYKRPRNIHTLESLKS